MPRQLEVQGTWPICSVLLVLFLLLCRWVFNEIIIQIKVTVPVHSSCLFGIWVQFNKTSIILDAPKFCSPPFRYPTQDVDEIMAVLRTRRLRWYGHVQRATSCINSIMQLGVPGTRNRGRPRKTWSACVRNDMTICNLDGVNPLDRNSWRKSVRRCQVLPTPESGTTAAP